MRGSPGSGAAALTSRCPSGNGEWGMKPLLSDRGTLDIGFGIFACVVGALDFVFGAGVFQSSALLAVGLGLACYGLTLRRAWNKRMRDQPEERRKQQ
jgi:hypothetical protein